MHHSLLQLFPYLKHTILYIFILILEALGDRDSICWTEQVAVPSGRSNAKPIWEIHSLAWNMQNVLRRRPFTHTTGASSL